MSEEIPADDYEFVKLVLPRELYERLLAIAIDRGMSISDLLDRTFRPPGDEPKISVIYGPGPESGGRL